MSNKKKKKKKKNKKMEEKPAVQNVVLWNSVDLSAAGEGKESARMWGVQIRGVECTTIIK